MDSLGIAHRSVMLLIVGLILSIVPLLQAEPPDATQSHLNQKSTTDEEIFKWFDGLGYPSLSKRSFVRVETGWTQDGDEPPLITYSYGFLLQKTETKFKVMFLDLSQNDYEQINAKSPQPMQTSYELADLQKVANEYLKALRNQSDNKAHRPLFHPHTLDRTKSFVLARGCVEAGLNNLAGDLLAESMKLPNYHGKPIGRERFQAVLSEQLAHEEMWRTVADFGDPKVTRSELMSRFRRIVEHFPSSEYVERAKATAALLEKMIAEDEQHKKLKIVQEGKLTKQEQIAEWIFQLRDQNGHQYSQPGACDIFSDPRDGGMLGVFLDPEKKGMSPASHLVRFGYDAVPQLIEVVDDKRFTRSVGYHRNFYFSHHVLRVGDCAVKILERIASRRFYHRTYTNSEMVKDGEDSERKKLIQEWWAEVQSKGIKQVLIEGTVSGDDNSPQQAAQLAERFPDDALTPIMEGARRSKDAWTRTSLMHVAAILKNPNVTTFLHSEMNEAPFLDTRVAAAAELLKRKQENVVPAMIEEWRKIITDAETKESQVGDFRADGLGSLISLLATCGDAEAVSTLSSDLHRHQVGRRLEIVSKFGYRFSSIGVSSFGGVGSLDPSAGEDPESPEVSKAIEELLITALRDTQAREGMSGSWDEKSFTDPRVCDIAGHVLNMRWPEKYKFDLAENLYERDRQRIAMINVWRSEHKVEPLPLPKGKTVERLPRDVTEPKLKAIELAPTDRVRNDEVANYEKLGLPALAALRERLAQLPDDHSAKKAMQESVVRMGCIVSEIRYVKDHTAVPDKALQDRLEVLRGKPLSTRAFVKVLIETAKKLPPDAAGIKLTATRSGDGTGISIVVALPTERVFQAGTQKGWVKNVFVSIAREQTLNLSGGSSLEYGVTFAAHRNLIEALDEALASPPDTEFFARVNFVRER